MSVAFKDVFTEVYESGFVPVEGINVEFVEAANLARIFYNGQEVARYQAGYCHAAIVLFDTGEAGEYIARLNGIDPEQLALHTTEGGNAVDIWHLRIRPPYNPRTEKERKLTWDWEHRIPNDPDQYAQYFEYLVTTVCVDLSVEEIDSWRYVG